MNSTEPTLLNERAEKTPEAVLADFEDACNLILEEAGFEIGKDWLPNKNYAGMTADEIYNMLPNPPDATLGVMP